MDLLFPLSFLFSLALYLLLWNLYYSLILYSEVGAVSMIFQQIIPHSLQNKDSWHNTCWISIEYFL